MFEEKIQHTSLYSTLIKSLCSIDDSSRTGSPPASEKESKSYMGAFYIPVVKRKYKVTKCYTLYEP